MQILTPVIGVPNYSWKKRAVKYARKHENIVKVDINGFCYQCDRYTDLLCMFDNGDEDYKKSDYFTDRKKRGGKGSKDILKKIINYKSMYEEIKGGKLVCLSKFFPIVTQDGCRLDGTHRLTILMHLGIYEANINIVIYNRIFSKKVRGVIIKENMEYRKEKYNL